MDLFEPSVREQENDDESWCHRHKATPLSAIRQGSDLDQGERHEQRPGAELALGRNWENNKPLGKNRCVGLIGGGGRVGWGCAGGVASVPNIYMSTYNIWHKNKSLKIPPFANSVLRAAEFTSTPISLASHNVQLERKKKKNS
jgi:hypothetical protein